MRAITGVRTVPCPTCHAQVGDRCFNVRVGYTGYAKNTHKTRIDAYRGQPRTRVGPSQHTPLVATLCMRTWGPDTCDGWDPAEPLPHRCVQNRWVPHVCFCGSCAWQAADAAAGPQCPTP